MSLSYTPATICAIATAPGRGGVGVIRVSGKDLLPFAAAVSGGKTRRATRCTPISSTPTASRWTTACCSTSPAPTASPARM